MEFLRWSLLVLHLCGLTVLAVAFVVRLARRGEHRSRADPALLASSLALLITGMGLVAVDQTLDRHLDDGKIGVKLAVLLVILGLIIIDRRRRLSPGAFVTIGLLAAADVGVAVLWT